MRAAARSVAPGPKHSNRRPAGMFTKLSSDYGAS